jgi:hypothetical protein
MTHETPSDEIFNEMKAASTKIWKTYDNQFGYVSEKLERIEKLRNYEDNAMICYRMFDYINQTQMRELLSQHTLNYIDTNL